MVSTLLRCSSHIKEDWMWGHQVLDDQDHHQAMDDQNTSFSLFYV